MTAEQLADKIATDVTFTYTFRAEPAGTYFCHSHVGLQLDRGLLGPLIVEEREPHVEYDREYVVIVDDYLRGEPELPSDGEWAAVAEWVGEAA